MREVVGLVQDVENCLGGAEGEKSEPEQRRDVREHAVDEQRAMDAEESFGEEQAEMLQIALTPTPIALHFFQQRRRHLLVTAAQVVRQPERPTGAAHQRRFHEVVAEDLAAERRLAGQLGQSTLFHEGRDAEDRVVTPVLPVAELPEVQAGGEHRPVDAAGELLHAGEERAPITAVGAVWNHAGVGFALHHFDHAHQRLAVQRRCRRRA